eukprot:GILI01010231.1.p2 GENE.GILI01010231.1~~GILI01010231.1.p2  ORF type:complete len:203 (+),score=68.46 GILI01010231.1:45-653(+)
MLGFLQRASVSPCAAAVRTSSSPFHMTVRLFGLKKGEKPIRPWVIYKGDVVEVVDSAFEADQGKQGKVLQVFRDKNLVLVEGLRMRKKLVKDETQRGFWVSKETPLRYTELALVDPKDGQPTEVALVEDENNKQVRISLRTGVIMEKPAVERPERKKYVEGEKDTPAEKVLEVTYKPSPALAAISSISLPSNTPSSSGAVSE